MPGYIHQFLSARFWIPLSRLTYSVYLIHLIVIHFMFFARNDRVYYDRLTAVSMPSARRFYSSDLLNSAWT